MANLPGRVYVTPNLPAEEFDGSLRSLSNPCRRRWVPFCDVTWRDHWRERRSGRERTRKRERWGERHKQTERERWTDNRNRKTDFTKRSRGYSRKILKRRRARRAIAL